MTLILLVSGHGVAVNCALMLLIIISDAAIINSLIYLLLWLYISPNNYSYGCISTLLSIVKALSYACLIWIWLLPNFNIIMAIFYAYFLLLWLYFTPIIVVSAVFCAFAILLRLYFTPVYGFISCILRLL